MRNLYLLRCTSSVIWLTFSSSSLYAQTAPPPPSAAAPADVPARRAELASGPTLRLDASGPALQVSVAKADTGVTLRAGKLSVPLPLSDVGEVTTEVVTLKGAKLVGVVRVTTAQRSAAVLVVKRPTGRLETLWTGQLQLVGDPGERRADALEIADRDGDGSTDIVVGSFDERSPLCGQDRALLAPRAVDPATLTLRSVLLNRAATRQVRETLVASTTQPAVEPPPTLRALRSIAASSAAQEPQQGAAAASDGDLASSWTEGRGLGGRFEFLTLRWSAPGRTIRALAIVPTSSAAATSTKRTAPRALSLLGDKGDRLVVTFPEEPKPGQRYWITPKEPLPWTCVSVSVDEVFAATPDPATHTGVAEIEAYTDLDFGGGMASLVAELSAPGTRGDDATRVLGQMRGDVIGALGNAWSTLPALGKRRALRLLFAQSPPEPRAIDVLRSALRDPSGEVNRDALEIARKRADVGPGLLLEVAREPTAPGDAAALALARMNHASALEGLLAALAAAGGSDRPILREAVALAFKAGSASAPATVTAWTQQQPPPPIAARVAATLALSRLPDAQPSALGLLNAGVAAAEEFSDQWRLIQAASTLPSDPGVDDWLAKLAHDAETWMLRAAAVSALEARRAASAMSTAEIALKDEYPRVRAAALKVLGNDSSKLEILSTYAQDDKWFLVRAAAVEALPSAPAGRKVMIAALKDKTPTVRATAARALQHAGAVEAWGQVRPLIENAEEYPEVIGAGISFARALCVKQSAPSLQAVVKRGLNPEAWSADQELALAALETLSALGGEAAAWARDHAQGPLVPKQVQAAAAAAASKPGKCRPAREL